MTQWAEVEAKGFKYRESESVVKERGREERG